MKPLTLGPFLGLNTRREPFALHTEEGDYLSAASNVYLDKTGHLHRRPGLTLIQAMTGAHSLFGLYLVRGAVLYRITLPAYSETLVKVLASDAPMSYCVHDGSIYFANGTDAGRIAADGTVYPWGLPTPAAPDVAEIVGDLPAGTYLVATSHSNATTGEEGGLSERTATTLATAAALRVTLPAVVAGATHINVYVSKLNGEAVGRYASVAAGTPTLDVTSTDTGETGEAKYIEPLPACTGLFMHLGRLCGIAGDTLYYGEPYRPGYYRPTKGRIRFEADIAAAAPNQGGVYVMTDKTQWIPGDLDQSEMIRDVLPYGAVPGTVFQHPSAPLVGWMGDKGFVLGDSLGQASAPAEGDVEFTLPGAGTAYVMNVAGGELAVSCGYCMNLETRAVTQWDGYALNSMSAGYGIAPVGVLALAGDSDNGTTIDATVGLGKLTFGTEALKNMVAAYLGMASASPMNFTVGLPAGLSYTYPTRGAGSALMMQRCDPGRGLRANWFEISIGNTAGADFTLASVSVAAAESRRRI